jgi:hypothetical protein
MQVSETNAKQSEQSAPSEQSEPTEGNILDIEVYRRLRAMRDLPEDERKQAELHASIARVRASIERINALMTSLKEVKP